MARKGMVAAVVVAAAVAAMGARLGTFEIRTSGQFLFDVRVDSNMSMSNGLRDAYDGCYMLRVSGAEVQTQSAAILFGGRGVQSPRVPVGGVTVSRQIYVPEEGDWARYFDLITNTTKTTQTVDVELYGNLGSDSSTKVVSSSDGDQLVETSDTWFSTDDFADGSGDPSLAHVFRRARGKLRPESVSIDRDNISIRYRLKLRPQKSSALVFFAVQTQSTAEAARLARELVSFGAKAQAQLARQDIARIAN